MLVIDNIARDMLIFPLFFAVCDWWKKIVNNTYEVDMKTYQSITQFVI